MTPLESPTASPDPDPRQPLAPDLSHLDDRSTRAWTEAMAVRPLAGGRYLVESQSGATYLVDLPQSTCSCPDHEIRGACCKHLRRVAIEVNERRVPPPGKTHGTCRICKTTTFVPESGPSVCDDCWIAPGTPVTDRETDDTVIVDRVTDEPADEWYLESAECLLADYPGNETYPRDDLVVTAVYQSSHEADTEHDTQHRYAFPYSRLTQGA